MPDAKSPPKSPEEQSERIAALLSQLNLLQRLQEPQFSSQTPFLGPLVVAVRRFWNWMSTKWYIQPILEQQSQFNERLLHLLDELAAVLLEQSPPESPAVPTRERPASPPPQGLGLDGLRPPGQMDAAELWSWENTGISLLDRHTNELEAQADELLDEDICLNYPLHWRTWLESWPYLFDLAAACELLGPCPGELVLDYAAGTCWTAELLNRLGVQTVSLDLSLDMLRRGRRRLAMDQRLENRTAATFAVGSALQLPFAAESFDAVLCMNALHHMPSYRQALQEIYRILKEGGRAVFSEPGAGHAESPVSQTRMRELGVLEKSVPLALIHRLAQEAGFARMKVIPLRALSSYVFQYTATPADQGVLEQMWEQTLRFGPREQARFVLEKGPERPLDSRMPPQALLGHVLRARITLCSERVQARSGETLVEQVSVANEGDVIWRARGLAGQVSCGLKICREDGQLVRDDLGRTPLPHDVAPGEEVRLELHIPVSLEPGPYLLKYDMVVEYVAWFEQRGSLPAQRFLEVTDS
ncbi:MAG: class I SAM-dependent methyltransferase [Chloroflexia bacterium]|nr:class I SAM-dependent methyltransferase [Chloroflexia bacterium]